MAYEVRPTALYTAADTWAKALPNGLIQIGISDFAQQQLGDLMYIDLPLARALAKQNLPRQLRA